MGLARLLTFSSGYVALAAVLPILVGTARFLEGTLSLGRLMQSGQAFQQVTAALSWPVDNLATTASWRASVVFRANHPAAAALDRLGRCDKCARPGLGRRHAAPDRGSAAEAGIVLIGRHPGSADIFNRRLTLERTVDGEVLLNEVYARRQAAKVPRPRPLSMIDRLREGYGR